MRPLSLDRPLPVHPQYMQNYMRPLSLNLLLPVHQLRVSKMRCWLRSQCGMNQPCPIFILQVIITLCVYILHLTLDFAVFKQTCYEWTNLDIEATLQVYVHKQIITAKVNFEPAFVSLICFRYQIYMKWLYYRFQQSHYRIP